MSTLFNNRWFAGPRTSAAIVAAVAVAASIGLCGPARAQVGTEQTQQVNPRTLTGPLYKPAPVKPAEKLPPALPGAASGAAAPAQHGAADLPPTEALFDAINRGDLPAARDAIARGAELQKPNILGLTPLELSVDLARNDITFLLLSFKGLDRAVPVAGAAPDKKGAAALTAADRKRARLAKSAAPPKAPEAVSWEPDGSTPAPAPQQGATSSARRSAAAPALPRQFSGDGGSPVPDQGFLGFGGGGTRATQ